MNLQITATQLLTELLPKPILKKLADSWLVMGATSFEIRDFNDQTLKIFTATASTEYVASALSELRATIVFQGVKLGELVIKGLEGKNWQEHLETDVAFLLQGFSLENELEELTSEYISAQDQLLALYELSHSMRHHLTLEGALKALVTEAARLSGAENAFIFATAPLEEQLFFAKPTELLSKSMVLSLWNELKDNGKDLIFNSPLQNGISDLLLTAIEIRGGKVAGLGLFNKPEKFTSPDIKLVNALAQQAGAQLDNMLLYYDSLSQTRVKAELDIATQIQAQLLNHIQPVIEDLDFFASFRAAREIGGDFFDFINLPDRPFVFGLGDVSGKGIPAALIMTMCRVVLHNAARGMPLPSPKAILTRMNEDLYDDFTEVRRFATLFVGKYDKAKEVLYFANAGHSPVILMKKGWNPILLEADGPPLGVFTTILSEDESISFQPGDILVVASDGFCEATNSQDEMFGYERLLDLVGSLSTLPAKEISERLFLEVKEFSGVRLQDDDQTLIVLKRVTK